ncbi:MAG: VWA domain-containing protein, partial [Caldilineaceae bacterium]|nr:VWA domain-containing protein [Caldilineaceae bacterium]
MCVTPVHKATVLPPTHRRPLFLILLLFLFLSLPQPALAHGFAPQPVDPSPLVARGQDKQGFITVTLRADRAVAPGETVNLIVEAQPTLDAAALTVQWGLPDGGEFLNGTDQVAMPTVRANEAVSFQRQLRFANPGVYGVTVGAGYSIGDSMTVSGAAVLYFTVQAAAPAVHHTDPRINLANQRIIPTTVTVGDDVVAANANGDPCFRIDGLLTRLDRRAVTSGGPFVDSRVPVAHVPVDMMEEDTLFDDYYGTFVTDAGGNFHFEFCDDDGLFDDELELYVVVRAEMWDDRGHKVVYVEDSSWIDETHEFESGRQSSEGGSLRFDMAMDVNYNPADYSAGNAFQSQVFNIADAIYNDWLFWNANSGIFFDETAEVHFEPGYGDDGSYYQPFWNEITVADGPNDNDGWDDSPIMHEWNHFADDVYGCDDTPGGSHSFFQNTGDTELAFSEGYANYYQGVARQMAGDPNANIYFDVTTAGGVNNVNFETFNTRNATLNSVFNEGAIAGMLWDLQDGADPVNDANDRVGYGVRPNQDLFTDPAYESNGDIFDDTCNVYVWLKAWRDTGKPATRDTAAAVSQNIGYTPPGFDGVVAAGQSVQAAAADALNVVPTALATGYRWWKQLTWVVDTSTSMAGPKLDGAKTVITEQLNDLNNDPQGVDFNLYTFNHEGFANTKVFENEFYADRITGQINGLAATSSLDLDCGNVVYGLGAMKQALVNKRAGDLWLFTDGRDAQFPKVETVVQQLNKQQVKGSIALMGGCATPPVDPNRLNGAESYLGNAAGPQSSGIVPYLVTALRSGGRFLFVEPDQLAQASDILRAQLANSAGAGRWSDYVSDFPFYRWDKLDSNEYRWIDALDTAGGTYHGQPHNAAIAVTLPQPFTIWGKTTSVLWANNDGYFLAGNTLDAPTLDILYNNNLQWAFRDCGPRAAGDVGAATAAAPDEVPCFTNYIQLYSKQEGDWFAVSILGNAAD